MFLAISFLLVGFITAIDIRITSSAVDNTTGLTNQNQVGLVNSDNENEEGASTTNDNSETAKKSSLTAQQIKKIIRAENRIKTNAKVWECLLGCTCTGSTVKCLLANGRELTIYAGNSGNVIVQVKGENMTTNVTLYKLNKKLYGVFRNNETREIKALPDQVKERIRERLERQLENENISLDDNGTYQYQADRKARLFAFIPVTVMVRAEIDPETGNIIKISKNPWWFFLAREESQQIVGASCGTVSPGSNDACCQNKGFDVWNSATNQCEFSQ